MMHPPLSLPSLAPLRARLLNALVSRALPREFVVDSATASAARCRVDLNDAAAMESPAPFSPAAALFFLTGDSAWKLEFSSLEPLALRPELAAWRASGITRGVTAGEEAAQVGKNDFSSLPEPLRLAVLERLFWPVLNSLARWIGCEEKFGSAPESAPVWAQALPLMLTLPGGKRVYLRLFWADEGAARFLLERLEALPLRVVPDAAALPDAALPCLIEIGRMCLSPEEAASLASGDILLPERWTPEAPRLLLPGGPALACRLENGVLSVLGPDATLPPPCGQSSDSSEVSMNDPVSEYAEVSAKAAGGTPVLDRDAIAALELPVTFELAGLSLRVEEVAAIAPGYTFALGGDVSSVPVFLRIGGRVAARGRLVDVGGMPGVQITGMTVAGDENRDSFAHGESRTTENPAEGK